MLKRIILAIICCSFAGIFSSFAQESVFYDSVFRDKNKITSPLLPDSLRFKQTPPIISLPELTNPEIESLLQEQPLSNNFDLNLPDTATASRLFMPPEFVPYAFFSIDASRWNVPIVGDVTTFSPMIAYQASKNLSFYGGVSFSQFHNLSYVQSVIAPGFPTKSNIIANGFVGASYRLFDRIILHGSYQRSLYNQLPSNMMMLAPGQNVVVAGASFDVWNGLGVTVDHVWEFDKYGHRREGFRYSPYIDVGKFIKFLKQ